MTQLIRPCLVVHGGAGDLEPERAPEAEAGCRRAIEAGLAALAAGGSALDAACAAVRVLEDDPQFNAGTGSALSRAGTVECDAAVMDGATVRIGAVAAMADAPEAISVARAVLDAGEHCLLCGEGAWAFAEERGFRRAAPGAMITARARASWEARADAVSGPGSATRSGGTVGACAIDATGHVAAATSTGGMPWKRPGRIGDTPLCGCGTYADDRGGAASATGPGEAILRVTASRVCVDEMRRGASAAEAAWAALDEVARVTGMAAGIICVDGRGRLAAATATDTMCFGAGRLDGGGRRLVVGVRPLRGTDVEDLLARS
jgi:beta-aspartyl-peptidase (threonine type)